MMINLINLLRMETKKTIFLVLSIIIRQTTMLAHRHFNAYKRLKHNFDFQILQLIPNKKELDA